VKASRNCSRTQATETVGQRPRGGNAGLQERPAALVHQAEPRRLLPAEERHLFGGVHLPDLMRSVGAAAVVGRLASGRSGVPPGPSQPALERAGAGDDGRIRWPPEFDADELGPPGGMAGAIVEDDVQQRRGRLGPAPVGRSQGLGAFAAALEEMLDGTEGKLQVGSDGGGVLALVVARPNGLAHGQRSGAWHGKPSNTRVGFV
jgi:hypothetical protein